MAFSRAAAFRSILRTARPSAARPQLHRQLARRTYASGGHGSAAGGGDAVWAAGSIALTVPACWYLLSSGPEDTHGHEHHGDSHDKEHGAVQEAVAKAEDVASEAVSGTPEKDLQQEEASEESGSGESATDPNTADDEPKRETLTPTSEAGITKREKDAEEKQGDEGKKQPAEDTRGQISKSIEEKQGGLSNDDTRHSTDLNSIPGRSRKGEGDIETAKLNGSVDPKRPTDENNTD